MVDEASFKMLRSHQGVFEQDLVLFRVRGDYELSDAQQVGDVLVQHMARWARIFILIDQAQAGAIPPESRRFLAEWNKQYTLGGVANFGGSTTARVVATLLMNAYRLIRPAGAPMIHADSEADARVWVAALRTRA